MIFTEYKIQFNERYNDDFGWKLENYNKKFSKIPELFKYFYISSTEQD